MWCCWNWPHPIEWWWSCSLETQVLWRRTKVSASRFEIYWTLCFTFFYWECLRSHPFYSYTDLGTFGDLSPHEKWLAFKPEQKQEVEKYISAKGELILIYAFKRSKLIKFLDMKQYKFFAFFVGWNLKSGEGHHVIFRSHLTHFFPFFFYLGFFPSVRLILLFDDMLVLCLKLLL